MSRRAGEISDEPLINAVHRRLPEFFFAALLLLIIYASFVPFDFALPRKTGWAGGSAWGLAVRPFNIPDILVNIGLYLPIGATGYLVSRRRAWGRWTGMGAAAATCVLVSFTVEQGQNYLGSRVASWIDLTANCLGGLMGVLAAAIVEPLIRRGLRRLRLLARENWWMLVCKAVVCLVLLVQLRPYDVVTDVRQAAKQLIRAHDVRELIGWHRIPARLERDARAGRRSLTELGRLQWEYVIESLANVAIYSAVVALSAVAYRPLVGRRRAFAAGCLTGACLAGIVALIRVFLISHGPDLLHPLWGFLACPIGGVLIRWLLPGQETMADWPPGPAGCGARGQAPLKPVISRAGTALLSACDAQAGNAQAGDAEPAPSCHGIPAIARRRRIEWLCAGVTILLLSAYELAPFDWSAASGPSRGWFSRICWVPFLWHLRTPPNAAFLNVSGDLLRYAALAACLSSLVRRTGLPWHTQFAGCVTLCAAASVIFETSHLFMPTRHSDITNVLLAAIGGALGAVALRWACDYHAATRAVHVEDLLTAQLMEGPTYDKSRSVSGPRSRRSGAFQRDRAE